MVEVLGEQLLAVRASSRKRLRISSLLGAHRAYPVPLEILPPAVGVGAEPGEGWQGAITVPAEGVEIAGIVGVKGVVRV